MCASVCRCARVCICVHVCMCVQVCVCVHMYAFVCRCMHVFTCVPMCMRVHATFLLFRPSQQGVRTALLHLRSVPHPHPDPWPPTEGTVASLFKATPNIDAWCSRWAVACFLVGCLCSSVCQEMSATPIFQPGSRHKDNLECCQLCPGPGRVHSQGLSGPT